MKKFKSYTPSNAIESFFFISLVIVIPLSTLFLCAQADLLFKNLTYVANQNTFRFIFFVWGVFIVSIFFAACLYTLWLLNNINTQDCLLLLCFFISALISLFSPYKKEPSLMNQIHILTSVLTCIFFGWFLFHLLIRTKQKAPLIFFKQLQLLQIACFLFLFLLLLIGDISSALEGSALCFCSIYLYFTIISLNPIKT